MTDNPLALFPSGVPTFAELRALLQQTAPGDALLPELEWAKSHSDELRGRPHIPLLLASSEPEMDKIEQIPQLTHSLYREFGRTGYWQNYGRTFFNKRARCTAAAFRLFIGQDEWLETVQDYIWSICEETTWVIPYHESHEVDLFSSETAFMFAQMIAALGDKLVAEVQQRMRAEVERRVLAPYLARHDRFGWYKGGNNWNGVCNGSIGSTFLLLEKDPDRLATALKVVLESLDTFIQRAFEADGTSNEGPGYWQYGLSHFVSFAEMLRQRTRGKLDLLASDRLRAIARYPLAVMLSPGRFANFADADEQMSFSPALITRLAERTNTPELVAVLSQHAAPAATRDQVMSTSLLSWKFQDALRALLWWDGERPMVQEPPVGDLLLASAGIVRLQARTAGDAPVVLVFKAGHNAENHNHNDVGTFIVHVDGETFLCEAGRGLYDHRYFKAETRYQNIFASSYGHSVPRVDGQNQSAGRKAEGEVKVYEPDREPKRMVAEIGQAYTVPGLESIQRTITLTAAGKKSGTMWLEDRFVFSDDGHAAEEAFITWLDVEIAGSSAKVLGERHDLRLTIEEPVRATFTLQTFEEECRANEQEGVLRRLAFPLRAGKGTLARVRLEIERK